MILFPEMAVTEVVKKFLLAVSAVPRWSRQFAPEHQHGPQSTSFFFHRYSADKVTVLGRAMFATERMMDSYGLTDDYETGCGQAPSNTGRNDDLQV